METFYNPVGCFTVDAGLGNSENGDAKSESGFSTLKDGYYGYPISLNPLYYPSGISYPYDYPMGDFGTYCGMYGTGEPLAYPPAAQYFFGGEQSLANTVLYDPMESDKGMGDSKLFGEISTCAPTPTLSASANPDTPNDNFELTAMAATSTTPMASSYPSEHASPYQLSPYMSYYAGYPVVENSGYWYQTNNGGVFGMDEAAASEEAQILEIANQITANVQYLPAKDMNGKYSLDKNHPIHCVWRDLNRGHCSWRCRWWEDGKRLSKNFNVKRFGDAEAMRMAITMKIRNSAPMERLQLLKEQREAVRNHLELLKQSSEQMHETPLCPTTLPAASTTSAKRHKSLSCTKRIQRENWARLAWTYVKVPDHTRADDTSVICRLCAKTTRCSRSRNLQQAHIMHLIRMHKNPWKQYIQVEGLTKMCRAAIEALYQQQNFGPNSPWQLRPGTIRPEPPFQN